MKMEEIIYFIIDMKNISNIFLIINIINNK
jgi:hypothetical protein